MESKAELLSLGFDIEMGSQGVGVWVSLTISFSLSLYFFDLWLNPIINPLLNLFYFQRFLLGIRFSSRRKNFIGGLDGLWIKVSESNMWKSNWEREWWIKQEEGGNVGWWWRCWVKRSFYKRWRRERRNLQLIDTYQFVQTLLPFVFLLSPLPPLYTALISTLLQCLWCRHSPFTTFFLPSFLHCDFTTFWKMYGSFLFLLSPTYFSFSIFLSLSCT